jgi:hypothetical protein
MLLMANPELPALDTRGRKPNRLRHAEAVKAAEEKFARKLPRIADMALEMAEGREPEKCRKHKQTLMCPSGSAEALDAADGLIASLLHELDFIDPVLEERVRTFSDLSRNRCGNESAGFPANERMVQYVMNRIAGTPTPAGKKQVSLEFVRQVTKHIADVFKEVNKSADPEERARNFAMGISQLWVLVGESGADA